MAETKSFNQLLADRGLDDTAARKVTAYINEAKAAETRAVKSAEYKRKQKPSTPVLDNDPASLAAMAGKYWNMGLLLDGVNVVITGKSMAMVTAHGYKNKVLQVYPESEFDMQLVRETDTFSFAKESGDVVYSHQMNDPFDNKPIVGAYLVYKNRRGQSIELLNKRDYDQMKNASRQPALWDKWDSEFWLKSVMKRAGKRHFYDAIAEIDTDDNEVYGLDENAPVRPDTSKADAIAAAIASMETAKTLDELKDLYVATRMINEPAVVEAKDRLKTALEKAQAEKPAKVTKPKSTAKGAAK